MFSPPWLARHGALSLNWPDLTPVQTCLWKTCTCTLQLGLARIGKVAIYALFGIQKILFYRMTPAWHMPKENSTIGYMHHTHPHFAAFANTGHAHNTAASRRRMQWLPTGAGSLPLKESTLATGNFRETLYRPVTGVQQTPS